MDIYSDFEKKIKTAGKITGLKLVSVNFIVSFMLASVVLVLTIFGVGAPILETYYLSKVIDYIIARNNSNSFIIKYGVIIFVSIIYARTYTDFISYIMICLRNKIREYWNTWLYKNVVTLEYCEWENPERLDLISRVCNEPDQKVIDTYVRLLNVFVYCGQLVGIMYLIALKNIYVAVLFGVISFFSCYISYKSGKAVYHENKSSEYYKRQRDYYREVLIDRKYASEREIFDISNVFLNIWKDASTVWRVITFKAQRKWLNMSIIGISVVSAILFLAIYILLIPLSNSEITIGFYIAIVARLLQMLPIITWSIPEEIERLTELNEYIVELDDVLKSRKNEGKFNNTLVINNPVTLTLNDVCFSYPNSERMVLNHFSYKFESGKTYALVGENGAGKTTLVKLLLGLYTNYTGNIKINSNLSENLGKIEQNQYFDVIFQDFAKYNISYRENCYFDRADIIKDNDVLELLGKLGLGEKVSENLLLADCPIGKIHSEGVELSGGQWQKLALARMLANDKPIRILDEPTASLDPLSEQAVYRDANILQSKGITILITHRLASVKECDCILLLSDGRVCEDGSFDELVSKDTMFKKMYDAQKKWYKDEETCI